VLRTGWWLASGQTLRQILRYHGPEQETPLLQRELGRCFASKDQRCWRNRRRRSVCRLVLCRFLLVTVLYSIPLFYPSPCSPPDSPPSSSSSSSSPAWSPPISTPGSSPDSDLPISGTPVSSGQFTPHRTAISCQMPCVGRRKPILATCFSRADILNETKIRLYMNTAARLLLPSCPLGSVLA
jgi:hypothetical protein